eukprot:COSAG02_NODE_13310_length_1411_cov_11.904726_2_plen_138_part_00
MAHTRTHTHTPRNQQSKGHVVRPRPATLAPTYDTKIPIKRLLTVSERSYTRYIPRFKWTIGTLSVCALVSWRFLLASCQSSVQDCVGHLISRRHLQASTTNVRHWEIRYRLKISTMAMHLNTIERTQSRLPMHLAQP